jgi:cyclopropane-fatty-acyl-phospholipid synthase
MGIRRLLRERLREIDAGSPDANEKRTLEYVRMLKSSPLAVHTREANEQHYEVPTEFYLKALGPNRKYSCALYPTGQETLEQAEALMLDLTCERSELAMLSPGAHVLELGCGWGSLTLWMARKFPQLKITAVSNSRTQKAFIDGECARMNLKNVRIVTCDMNAFEPPEHEKYERVVSVEMFEHMRNYQLLLKRIAGWLAPNGKLFVHIFTHKSSPYLFEAKDESDWMSRYFFTGGQMPSNTLFEHFQEHLKIEQQWVVSGMHYARTAEHWLKNMDAHRREIRPLFDHPKWWAYWRIFFMACAELWAFDEGREWMVCHYRFSRN